jgi:CBS domain-containing protein
LQPYISEVAVMGLFTTALALGAGYYAGMRLGDRPVRAVRDARDQMRGRAEAVGAQASDLRTRASDAARALQSRVAGAAGDTTLDVRAVREVMSAAPETVDIDTSVREAAEKMRVADIGNVIVTENGQVRGILTDRDIAVRAVSEGKDPNAAKVGDIMTPSPVTIEPSESVKAAIDLMHQHDIRRLPVVQKGLPVGVVALADVSMSPRAQPLLADISTAPPNN